MLNTLLSKRRVNLLLFLFLSLILFFSLSAHAKCILDRKLIIAVDRAYLPFTITNAKGQIEGFDIDLIKNIMSKMGCRYELRPMDFDGVLMAVQTRNVDMAAAGITITEKRKEQIDFSDGYYKDGLILLVSKNQRNIKDIKDLEGKSVAVKLGSVAASFIRDNTKDIRIRYFPNESYAYKDVDNNQSQAVLHNAAPVDYFLTVNPIYDHDDDFFQFKKIGDMFDEADYGFGFPKGSPLKEAVNKALSEIRKDGTYEKIKTRWFGGLKSSYKKSPESGRKIVSGGILERIWDVVKDSWPVLVDGAKMTLYISTVGLLGGLLLGLIAGIARAYGNKYIKAITVVPVEIIRGTPMVVQAMFIYFALPAIIHLRITPFAAAVITIILNSGAYISEIARGAIISINKGFKEAGLALGLSRWQVLRLIVAPLAFRRMLPALGNQWIVSIKDTSLFVIIGVGELTGKGSEIVNTNFRVMEVWTIVAIGYLLITLLLSLALRRLEHKLKIV